MELIAISGLSGCGNSSLCRELSRRLRLPMLNFTLRDLAAERGLKLAEAMSLSEADPSWDREIDARQKLMVLESQGIVGSRLAIWNLRNTGAFTVYLDAPLEVRSRRIAAREGKTYDVALSETRARDNADRERFLDRYGIDLGDFSWADLVVDVSKRTVAEVASVVLNFWSVR